MVTLLPRQAPSTARGVCDRETMIRSIPRRERAPALSLARSPFFGRISLGGGAPPPVAIDHLSRSLGRSTVAKPLLICIRCRRCRRRSGLRQPCRIDDTPPSTVPWPPNERLTNRLVDALVSVGISDIRAPGRSVDWSVGGHRDQTSG
jgi:hypothetical protein